MSVTYAAAPAAAGRARQLLARLCHEADLPSSLCEDAVLLVSELVSNVVVHGGPQARVCVSTNTEGIRVDVSDDGRAIPRLPPHDLMAESGRGLQLLDACASCWGIHQEHIGKTVWFELRVTPDGVLRVAR